MQSTGKAMRSLASYVALSTIGLVGACSSWGSYDGSYVCGNVGGAAGPVSFGPPVVSGPAASLTTGQTPMFNLGLGKCTPGSLCGPRGIKLINGAFYVVSSCDHRVLVWNAAPTQQNQPADRVIGQPTLTQCAQNAGGAIGGNTLAYPFDVASDGKILAVLDQGNDRVLVFDPIPTGTGPSASYALSAQSLTGQPSAGCPNSPTLSLYEPQALAIAGSKLVVTDTGNNRTLVWDPFPVQPLTPEGVLLGQGSHTSCSPPMMCSALTSQTQASPSGVWTDGTRLFVSDTRNDRVLLWKSFPTTANQPPDLVLGPALAGAAPLNGPTALTSNGDQLLVADTGNNRILIWNSRPTSSTTGPDVVLGQLDMTSTGSLNGQQGFLAPGGLLLAGGHLWVSDSGHGRVTVF
jgi:hypothetical protein